jgi:hypothetical protein
MIEVAFTLIFVLFCALIAVIWATQKWSARMERRLDRLEPAPKRRCPDGNWCSNQAGPCEIGQCLRHNRARPPQ